MRGDLTLTITSLIFGLIAIYMLFSGFNMPTSITVDGSGTVANLELMHIQTATLAVGIGAAIISAILAIGAAIVTAIRSR